LNSTDRRGGHVEADKVWGSSSGVEVGLKVSRRRRLLGLGNKERTIVVEGGSVFGEAQRRRGDEAAGRRATSTEKRLIERAWKKKVAESRGCRGGKAVWLTSSAWSCSVKLILLLLRLGGFWSDGSEVTVESYKEDREGVGNQWRAYGFDREERKLRRTFVVLSLARRQRRLEQRNRRSCVERDMN
jgi:hypothetical protein